MDTPTHTAPADGGAEQLRSRPADRLLNKPEVARIVGRGQETIRRLERDGKFPKRIKVNPDGRSVAWLESEINAWLAERASARGAGK